MMRNSIACEIHTGLVALAMCAALSGSAFGDGDDAAAAPQPSKHQLIKDCMAKQRAANSGLPKEDMKSACKDVAKTEKQNEDAAKKAAEQSKPSN